MDLRQELNNVGGFTNLELLAKQVVEGFIAGMHKSPFHGFSAEFAEHKIYNSGESTRHVDWKLFAKTDKLYIKRYDDETNLRCHVILDNSSSMHYPDVGKQSFGNLNKIGFSVLATAALMQMFKKQRDAIGLSVYSDKYDFYSPEKGSDRHHHMLLNTLKETLDSKPENSLTETYDYLHLIAEKIHRRSMIFLFTDMFQTSVDDTNLFEALRHLKYNKHEVVLFHVYDGEKELKFDFDNSPRRFVDVETGEYINLYAENIKDTYTAAVKTYFDEIKMKCLQYKINYVPADIRKDFDAVLMTYLVERQKFI